MLGNRWPHKPPIGYEIDGEHPLSRGMYAFFPLWEGNGLYARDSVNGIISTATSGAAWKSGPSGLAQAFMSSGHYSQTPSIPGLSVNYPITIAAGFRMLGTPSGTAQVIGIYTTGLAQSPAIIGVTSANLYIIAWANGSSSASGTSSTSAATNVDSVAALTVTDTSQTLYLNGVTAYALSNAIGNAAGSNPFLDFGYNSLLAARNPNYQIYWAGLWNRTLSPAEHAALAANPWQVYEPRRVQTYFGMIAPISSPGGIRLIASQAQPPESGVAIAVPLSIVGRVIATKNFLTVSEAPQPYSGTIVASCGHTAAVRRFDCSLVVTAPCADLPQLEPGRGLARCTLTQARAGPTQPFRLAATEGPTLCSGAVLATAEHLQSLLLFSPRALSVLAAAEPQPWYPGSVLVGRNSQLIVGSGFYIYSNEGSGDPINYATPVAYASTNDTTRTRMELAAPGAWRFGVRAFNSNGEEQNLDCAVMITLDTLGNDISNQPLPPTGLRAFATPNGSIRVEWYYPSARGPTSPIGFDVYLGIGGSPNYSTPAATVLYSAGFFNAFVSNIAGLISGTTYSIGVRAYNGSGAEQNVIAVSVTADAIGPNAVDSLFATAIV
jgi:hypothetical protein